MVVTPGGVRVGRRWILDAPKSPRELVGGGTNVGTTVFRPVGEVQVTEFTPKARRRMRWVWNALPWDQVPNLAMLTLTYPGDWQAACPNGDELRKQLRRFRERWRRRWGAPRGVWALEFQQRGAPHFHLYVGLPDGIALERDRLELLRWPWASKHWYDSVKSGDPQHLRMGVHVRRAFYGEYGNGRSVGKKVGDYFWRESGKLEQKIAPEGFEGVRWWDVWGLTPVEHERTIDKEHFVAVRRPLRSLRDKVTGFKVQRPNGLDGLAVTNVDGIGVGVRLLQWAQEQRDDDESL